MSVADVVPFRSARRAPSARAEDAFDLSIVIPAFNEAGRLPLALDRLAEWSRSLPYSVELIVVDDGSRDATARAAVAHPSGCGVIRLLENVGKGAAVRTGVLEARGRVVAFTDADLPYRMDAIELAFDLIDTGGADVVYGARDLRESAMQVRRSFHRKLASRSFQAFTALLVSREIRDTQCGLKAFSRQAAREIFPRVCTDGFAFDAEAVLVGRLLGLIAARIPVVLVHEAGSTVSLRRHGPQMLRDIVKSHLRHARGVGPKSAAIPDHEILRTAHTMVAGSRRAA